MPRDQLRDARVGAARRSARPRLRRPCRQRATRLSHVLEAVSSRSRPGRVGTAPHLGIWEVDAACSSPSNRKSLAKCVKIVLRAAHSHAHRHRAGVVARSNGYAVSRRIRSRNQYVRPRARRRRTGALWRSGRGGRCGASRTCASRRRRAPGARRACPLAARGRRSSRPAKRTAPPAATVRGVARRRARAGVRIAVAAARGQEQGVAGERDAQRARRACGQPDLDAPGARRCASAAAWALRPRRRRSTTVRFAAHRAPLRAAAQALRRACSSRPASGRPPAVSRARSVRPVRRTRAPSRGAAGA